MTTLRSRWRWHLVIVTLVLVSFIAMVPAGTDAAVVTTRLTVDQTVRNHREQCSVLSGTFSTGGWTTPGDKPGTMVSTTYIKCDLGGGDATTCYHTPGKVDCRVNPS